MEVFVVLVEGGGKGKVCVLGKIQPDYSVRSIRLCHKAVCQRRASDNNTIKIEWFARKVQEDEVGRL